MLLIPLKKTRLMRYCPIYTCRFDSFLNRYPIKPNLIYVKDLSNTNNNIITKKNVNNLLKCRKKNTLYNKNTNKKNRIKTHKYYTTMGVTGIFLSIFFYSYSSYSYYENAIITLTMYK
jgi:hypothetical protein